MDVFSSLPLELVGEILVYLTSEELVSCLQVSSAWRHVVSSFRGLWAQQCVDYGLPGYYIQGQTADSLVPLFLAARRQRNYIATRKHKVYPDVRNAVAGKGDGSCITVRGVQARQVVYAGNGILVVVAFSLREGQVQATWATSYPETGEGSFSGVSSIGASFIPYKELKQRYKFEYLLIERLNKNGGKAEELCRVALEDKWKWPVVTQAIAADNQSWVVLRIKETWIETAWYKIILQQKREACSGPCLQLPDFSSLHHRSNPYDISCCHTCSTVALVKNKLSMRPPWEFSIDIVRVSNDPPDQQVKEYTIPILNYDTMRLSSDVHTNVVFRPTFFCQQPSHEGDSCTSHKLVLWRTNDHTITVHNYSEKEGVSNEPIVTFTPASQGKTVELSTAWGHARLKFSADYQLLGFLMARYLHLWSLVTYEKLQTVYLDGIPGLRSWTLALGHVYSLFGTLHEEGEMVVVSTQTGKVVWRCKSFLEPGVGSPMRHGQLHGVVDEDWMNGVHKFCPTNTPLVLYSHLPQLEAIGLSGLAFSA